MDRCLSMFQKCMTKPHMSKPMLPHLKIKIFIYQTSMLGILFQTKKEKTVGCLIHLETFYLSIIPKQYPKPVVVGAKSLEWSRNVFSSWGWMPWQSGSPTPPQNELTNRNLLFQQASHFQLTCFWGVWLCNASLVHFWNSLTTQVRILFIPVAFQDSNEPSRKQAISLRLI